jgi:hypothetical protein
LNGELLALVRRSKEMGLTSHSAILQRDPNGSGTRT